MTPPIHMGLTHHQKERWGHGLLQKFLVMMGSTLMKLQLLSLK